MQKFIAVCALFAIIAVVRCVDPPPVQIIRSELNKDDEGSYNWALETSDGTVHEESGVVINPGAEEKAVKITGSYKYIDPNGEEVSVQYTADENGFVPIGSHIPQEISDAALDARNHPELKGEIQPNAKKPLLIKKNLNQPKPRPFGK